jgi:copper chaperone CopZ
MHHNYLAAAAILIGLALGCDSSLSSPSISPVASATPTDDKKKDDGLPTETMLAAFNPEGAPTVVFSVPDMMCEGSCCPTVRKTLAGQPGVKDVKVELASKTATVAVDKDTFDADAAIAALVDLQFVHTELASDAKETASN